MKTVVQKGIAGLGNRFQVLGYCFDVAKKKNAKLLVDWRDSSWRDNFSNYFVSDIILDFEDGEYPDIKPEWWSDKINSKVAKNAAKKEFVGEWETLVICQYNAKYSDEIFKHIDFHTRIYNKYSVLEFPSANKYDCWHIRATDKTAGDPFAILKKIIDNKTSNYKVIITDNLDIKNKAIKNNIVCQSIIPPIPKKYGVHHSTDEYLKINNITKRDLNDSALVDLLIGKNATNFYSTCENSSFSQLIKRLRN